VEPWLKAYADFVLEGSSAAHNCSLIGESESPRGPDNYSPTNGPRVTISRILPFKTKLLRFVRFVTASMFDLAEQISDARVSVRFRIRPVCKTHNLARGGRSRAAICDV
jgi:hypothetical protein